MNLKALQFLVAGGDSLNLELKKSTFKKGISTAKKPGQLRAVAQTQALLLCKGGFVGGVIPRITHSTLPLDSALTGADLVEDLTQRPVRASSLR